MKQILMGMLLAIAGTTLAQAQTTAELDQTQIAQLKQILKDSIKMQQASKGEMVLRHVQTGQSYHIVNQREKPDTTLWPIGSLVAPIAVAKLIDSGVVQMSTVVDTSPLKINGQEIRDSHHKSDLTVQQILAHSSNTGFAKLMLMQNPKEMQSYFQTIGCKAQSPTEKSAPNYRCVQTLNTPLQMATMGSNTLSDLPTITQIYAQLIASKGGAPTTPLKAETIEQIKQAMYTSTLIGSAVKAKVIGTSIGAVTASNDFINHQGKKQRNASVIAFAPSIDPQWIIGIRMVFSHRSAYGGEQAAQVLQSVIPVLKIPSKAAEKSYPIDSQYTETIQ